VWWIAGGGLLGLLATRVSALSTAGNSAGSKNDDSVRDGRGGNLNAMFAAESRRRATEAQNRLQTQSGEVTLSAEFAAEKRRRFGDSPESEEWNQLRHEVAKNSIFGPAANTPNPELVWFYRMVLWAFATAVLYEYAHLSGYA
jgi:hypothetical protein